MYMRQFSFETDIERRMPTTGKVFMIDRMTSDWAERHPLNVDQMIEDVYQEFAGSEFEESREVLHKVWTATLSMPIQGDKSIYLNNGGAHRPAAMKVWHTAGDYWRRGLRPGDVLPERCPSEKITRLPGGGWIALFPNDLHLLDDSTLPEIEESNTMEVMSPAVGEVRQVAETEVEETEEKVENCSPVVADADAAGMVVFQDDERIGDGLSVATAGTVPVCSEVAVAQRQTQQTERERNAERRRQRRMEREAQRTAYEERLEREAAEAETYARQQERRKIFAAVGAAAVTLTMIYFFGLLGPAIFGLLCGGLLKG